MAMAKETAAVKKLAEDEQMICRLAGECIELIDAAGGVGCSLEGVERVIVFMLKIIATARINNEK